MGKVLGRFAALFLFAFALALSAAACAKSDAGSPIGPSSIFTQAPGGPGPAAGATISGTVSSGPVVNSVRRAFLRSTGATLTVSIVGTSIAETVDESGRFTLKNVPSGNLVLAFSGNGVDARVTITDVNANDQIRIAVHVNGDSADLDEKEHEMANNEAEVEGEIISTNCSANPQTIVVGTVTSTVVDIQNAQIRHDGNTLTCAQLQTNDRVEAHGTMNGATIVATDVKVETDHGLPQQPGAGGGVDDDANEVEVEGLVAGAAAGHACPAFTFTIDGTTVTTDATTKFEDATCADVVNGTTVKVKGIRTGPSAISAAKVDKKGDAGKVDDGEDQNKAEVKGIVAGAAAGHACPAFTFTVGGTTVTTSATTKFEDTTCADIVSGNTVEVKGIRASASEISATKVEKKK